MDRPGPLLHCLQPGIAMSDPSPVDAPLSFVRLSEVRESPVSWLWPNRLALGAVALFEGDFGLGKSLAALDLCARLTTGREFPDASLSLPPPHLIILPADDATGAIV